MSSQYKIYDCEALVVLMDSISIYDLIISLNPIWMRFSQLFDILAKTAPTDVSFAYFDLQFVLL